MARWREMEKLRLHSHIRGSPDVTGTRKRNGIREEGNERDVVSQTLLQGGEDILLTAVLPNSFPIPNSYGCPNQSHCLSVWLRYAHLPSAVEFC